MSTPVAFIATAVLHPADMAAFTVWRGHYEDAAATFPGFLSSDLIPPDQPGSDEWTLILNFETAEHVATWQQAPERAALIAKGRSFFATGRTGTAVVGDAAADSSVTGVTGMIFSRLKPGMEHRYRDWAVRIQAAQAQYPGYRGMYLQPPSSSGHDATWTTLVRYDTAAHLEAWMASPERARFLEEAEAFVDNVEVARLATAFPGWVPVDPATGHAPPDWKTAMLIQLGLFPIVLAEIRFLNPLFQAWQIGPSLATFLSCTLSVALTSYLTMPLAVRWFDWWLYPKTDRPGRRDALGIALLVALFALEIAALWSLVP